MLFTEELKLDYVDEKTGEIPLSRFDVLGDVRCQRSNNVNKMW